MRGNEEFTGEVTNCDTLAHEYISRRLPFLSLVLIPLREIAAEDRDNYAARMEIYSIFMSTRRNAPLFTTPWVKPLIGDRLFKSAWDNIKSLVTFKRPACSLAVRYEYSNRQDRTAIDFATASFSASISLRQVNYFTWFVINGLSCLDHSISFS